MTERHILIPDAAIEYGCEEEYVAEIERRNNPTPEQIAEWKKEEEERKRIGYTRWIAKKRKEAFANERKRKIEGEKIKKYWANKMRKEGR